MKTITRKFYNKLYTMDAENASEQQMHHFIMCGDVNWEYYFDKMVDINVDYNEVKNIELLEFDNQELATEYLNTLQNNKLQDISFEKDYFGILIYK
jgi:hypothetical protein